MDNPQKRKCDIGNEPELCQSQNASDSPVKRSKSKFNSLLIFCGGGFKKESTDTHSKKISDKTQTWTQTFSETNPVLVDGDKVKDICPVDVDLEEGEGNQSQLSFCLKR